MPELAVPDPEHCVRKLKMSLVMKTRPSRRGEMPRNTWPRPSGIDVWMSRVRSRYSVAQTKIGLMTMYDADTAYTGIDESLWIDTMRTTQPAVEINAATNSGIVYLCLMTWCRARMKLMYPW